MAIVRKEKGRKGGGSAGRNRGRSPSSPRPVVSLALQMTNRERAAYSGLGDHGKHRLRRAISRLERDFVLLHSNQPGSGSGSGRERRPNQSPALKSLSLSPFLPSPAPSFIRPPSRRCRPPRGLANGPSAVLSDRFAHRSGLEGRETVL